MRCEATLFDTSTEVGLDVLIEGAGVSSLDQIADALASVAPAAGPMFVGANPLEGLNSWSTSSLVDGSVIRIGGPLRDDGLFGTQRIELRSVGGSGGVVVHGLAQGTFTIGRASDCDVCVSSDPHMSNHHAVLHVGDEVVLEDDGSRNGTLVDGNRISAPTALAAGSWFELGSTVFEVGDPSRRNAVTTSDSEGGLILNRVFRIPKAYPSGNVEIVPAPSRAPATRVRWLGLAVPVVGAVGAAIMLGNPRFLLLGVLSPLAYFGMSLSDRRSSKRAQAEEEQEFRERTSETERELASALATERSYLREQIPGPTACTLAALGPTNRLWERRPIDDDALRLRVGIGSLSARTTVRAPEGKTIDHELHGVPIDVPLRDVGVFGVAGPRSRRDSLARAFILQTAALHSPDDVRVVILATDGESHQWKWARWLPHVRQGPGEAPTIATSTEHAASLVRSIQSTFAERLDVASASDGAPVLPWIVLVCDGASVLRRSVPGLPELLNRGSRAGVFAICLDDTANLLPEECSGFVAFADGTIEDPEVTIKTATLSANRVLADTLDVVDAERAARALCPLRRIAEHGSAQLPSGLRLLEVLDLDPPTSEQVRIRWTLAEPRASATIGVDEHGEFSLELDNSHRSHALVAGSPGAGKSELLKSWIASLCVSHPPDQLNFFIVDYKGGGDLNVLGGLPHCVGVATSQDGATTKRAVTSLSAERDRRVDICNRAGARNLESYWKAQRSRDDLSDVLAHLVVVVDEFAQLKDEEPDLLDELLEIGRLGRSHGMHLLLATQRPTGVVSGALLALLPVRVALRMQEKADSIDILESAVAAQLPAIAGRAYAKSGNDAPQLFQTARVGGERPAVTAAAEAPKVSVLASDGSGRSVGRSPAFAREVPDEDTDLWDLIQVVNTAASDVARPQPLWLDPLRSSYDIEDLPRSDRLNLLVFGVEDVPEKIRQIPAQLDLEIGPTSIIGGPRSGRTTALRTVASAAVREKSPDDMHVYAFDCGDGSLRSLEDLPHCGVVALRGQVEQMQRLAARLVEVVEQRQRSFQAVGASSLDEYRQATEDQTPNRARILIVIDRWDVFERQFRNLEGGRTVEEVLRVVEEGPSVGITAVLTGDLALARGRVSEIVSQRLILPLSNRSDYQDAGLRFADAPTEVLPAGRAIEPRSLHRIQIALPPHSTDLTGGVNEARADGPFRIEQLPVSIGLAAALERSTGPARSPFDVVLGVGTDEAIGLRLDLLASGGSCLIAGPARSGRSTALAILAAQLVEAGVVVHALCPRSSVVEKQAHPLLRIYLGTDALSFDPQAFQSDDLSAVLIDDVDLFPAMTTLSDAIAVGGDRVVLAVAGLSDHVRVAGDIVAKVRSNRSGLLLWPQSAIDATTFAISLPRTTSITSPEGRGFLVINGLPTLVQVPNVG